MIRGIGVDMVRISRIEHILHTLSQGALSRMFAASELETAALRPSAAEYLASRFAVKEAVFKALAPLLNGEHFDLRIVETRNRDDGSPYVYITPPLQAVLDAANVTALLVSITTEGEYAAAFVVAVCE